MISTIIEAIQDHLSQAALPRADVQKDAYQDSMQILMSNNYIVLTPERLMYEQTTRIQSVAKQLNILPSKVRIMLKAMDWKADEFLRKFKSAQTHNKLEQFYEDMGVPLVDEKEMSIEDISREHECPCELLSSSHHLACLEEYPLVDMCGLSCRHFYCTDCYSTYLKLQITEGDFVLFF